MLVQSIVLFSLSALVAAASVTRTSMLETAFSSQQHVIAVGDAEREHVQALYDHLGQTFELPINPDGSNARITHLIMMKGNGTTVDPSRIGIEGRGPISFQNQHCAITGKNGNQVFTLNQQNYINVKFCSYMAGLKPDVWALAGYKVSNLTCGPTLNLVCNGIFAVSAAHTGVYIGSGIQTNCDSCYSEMREVCGINGGFEDATVVATGSTFLVEGYATTKNPDICSHQGTCSGFTCSGQCNPGNGPP